VPGTLEPGNEEAVLDVITVVVQLGERNLEMTGKKTIPALTYEIDSNGDVQLEQDGGMGETHYVTVHPVHIRAIADDLGFANPAVNRLLEIRNELAELLELLESVGCYPPQASDTEDVAACRRIVKRCDRFLDELGVDPVEAPDVIDPRGHHIVVRGDLFAAEVLS
jgi:hypothetical protein